MVEPNEFQSNSNTSFSIPKNLVYHDPPQQQHQKGTLIFKKLNFKIILASKVDRKTRDSNKNAKSYA